MDVVKYLEMFVWKIFVKIWNCIVVYFKNTERSWNKVILLFHLVSIVINNLLEMILHNSLLILTEEELFVYGTMKNLIQNSI